MMPALRLFWVKMFSVLVVGVERALVDDNQRPFPMITKTLAGSTWIKEVVFLQHKACSLSTKGSMLLTNCMSRMFYLDVGIIGQGTRSSTLSSDSGHQRPR